MRLGTGTRDWGRASGAGNTRLGTGTWGWEWGHGAEAGDMRRGAGTEGWGWGHKAGAGDVGLGTSQDPAEELRGSGLIPQWDLSWIPAGIWVGSRLGPGRMWAGSCVGSGMGLAGFWARSWPGSGLVSIWDLRSPSCSWGTPCSGPAAACPSPAPHPFLSFPLPRDRLAPTCPNACSVHSTQVPAPQDRGGQRSGAVGQPHRGLPGLQHGHRPQVPHPAQRQHQPLARPTRQPERLPGGV